jgi:hypothetical protein
MFITRADVKWDEKVSYTLSDYPSSGGMYPCTGLKQDSEVFINHKFANGREKIVLCGIVLQIKLAH